MKIVQIFRNYAIIFYKKFKQRSAALQAFDVYNQDRREQMKQETILFWAHNTVIGVLFSFLNLTLDVIKK